MSTLISAARRAASPPSRLERPVHFAARVVRAPIGWTDTIGVILPYAADAGDLREDIAAWPRPGGTLPAVDDACVVAYDDSGEPFIVAWKRPGWGT